MPTNTVQMDDAVTKEVNKAFFDQITSGDAAMQKSAQDAVTEFTRVRMREDGFLRRILPPITVTNDDLDRRVESSLPYIVVDREPESPAAYSVPFATLPMNEYIVGDRYAVDFARILTPRFATDIDELRTYHMDIRQVLSANALKDALAHEDGRFIQSVNTAMIGQNQVVPAAGTALWQTIAGGITRNTVNDALKILNRTPASLPTATILANQVFAKDLQKWTRNDIGGDLSQEIYQNGIAERTIFGARWIFTIKRNLVPDNTIFMFAEPKYLGKFFILEDMTMHLEREAYMLQFFGYESLGAAIGNVLACARVDFTA